MFIQPFESDDSDLDENSSGDDSATEERLADLATPPTVRTNNRTRQHWRNWRNRRRQVEQLNSNNGRHLQDYIVLEYVQNGELAGLIYKLSADMRQNGADGRIPNRVLWSFWLCRKLANFAMDNYHEG